MQVWAAYQEVLLACKIHLPKQLPTHPPGEQHEMTSLPPACRRQELLDKRWL